MPWAIANASYKRERRNTAVTEITEMPNRGHSLTIDNGWKEVAETALAFVRRSALHTGDRRMTRSVTGLFTGQKHVDRMVGTLKDAGFGAERISTVSPDDQAAGTTTLEGGRSMAGGLVDHLRQRGLSDEHAQQYHAHVAQGRCLVSVRVTTDAEDEEARSLMVDIGAEEISSAADGIMRVVQRVPTTGAGAPRAST